MKKLLFSILFCLLFLVGCGKPKAPEPTGLSINLIEATEPAATEADHAETVDTAEATEPSETTEIIPSTETPTTGPEPTSPSQSPSLPQPQKVEHPSTGYGLYDAVIEKCIAVSLHTTTIDYAALEEMQVPNVLPYRSACLNLHFATRDIDNNGNEELLLFYSDEYTYHYGSTIYAGYTINDGQLIWLLKGGERSRYYLCTDGKIRHHGASGAMYFENATYTYKDGFLSLDECYFANDFRDEKNPWFYSQIGSNDPNATPISEEAFNTATVKMEQTYMTLDGLTLQDYMAQDEQAIRSDVAVAAYREAQLHGKEKYQLWDTVLNRLWRILKYRQSSEEMKQLTQEQLVWIGQKEAAAENADSEKGFEIQAAYTKERIDTLLGLLRETDYFVEEN